jgi:WD40 repeat protein
MTWSSHENEALIASAADDNFVIVWNIESKEMVSLFDKHRSKVLSVCWDKIDNDKLFSGSEDRFIYHWNYRDFPCKMNEVKCKLITKLKRKKINLKNHHYSCQKSTPLNA